MSWVGVTGIELGWKFSIPVVSFMLCPCYYGMSCGLTQNELLPTGSLLATDLFQLGSLHGNEVRLSRIPRIGNGLVCEL